MEVFPKRFLQQSKNNHMKSSLDFDGIFTDESKLDLSVVNKEWFFWSERSVMYFPMRKGVRQIASLLNYFGELIITTARPVSHHQTIKKWLSLNAPELSNIRIVSSGNSHKTAILKSENVCIHIDDDFINASHEQNEIPFTIIWSYESPAEILNKVIKSINDTLQIESKNISISILALNSSTPTFLINKRNVLTKLKIFQEIADKERVKMFYKVAFKLDENVFLPEVVNWFPIAMESLFVEGTLAQNSTTIQRFSAIPYLANFLSKLHSIKIQSEDHLDKTKSYVSCAIDQFNVCLTADNKIALIDIADCILSNKWLDIIWAEQLYCTNDHERNLLVEHYAKGMKQFPIKEEVKNALREYYSWLHFIIASGRNWNIKDKDRVSVSNYLAKLRASPPENSILFKLCKQE